jgi:hypothetical protein
MVAYPFCPLRAAIGEHVTAGCAAFFLLLQGENEFRFSLLAIIAEDLAR